jgi:hypothetical protein
MQASLVAKLGSITIKSLDSSVFQNTVSTQESELLNAYNCPEWNGTLISPLLTLLLDRQNG